MTLADIVKKSKQQSDFFASHKMFHGFPKSGKTHLATGMVREVDGKKLYPLFITTEDGFGGMKGEHANIRVTSWEGFLKLLDVLEQNRAELAGYSCLVLDLVSELARMCSAYICKENTVIYPGDIGAQGKGWDILFNEFYRGMNRLLSLGLGVVFIAHSAEREVNYNGEKMKKQIPDVFSKGMNYLNSKCDFIGFLKAPQKFGQRPTVTFDSSGWTAVCGSRFQFMIREFPLHENPEQSATEMVEFFNSKIKEGV